MLGDVVIRHWNNQDIILDCVLTSVCRIVCVFVHRITVSNDMRFAA